MKNRNTKSFILFSLVGVLNTGITFIVYTVLVLYHTPYLIANVLGYGSGMLNSYFLNKKYVFHQEERHPRFLIKFSIVNVSILVIQSLLLFLFVSQFEVDKIFSQVFASMITLVLNYIGNKLWAFQ